MVEKDFNLKDIYLLLSLIPNDIGKAYVTFLLSSGLKKNEALNLTIKDLIDACNNEFRISEDRNLENLLKKDPTAITPIWKINTNKGTKITFSSSESLFYLFIYLNERLYENNEISLDEKLFVTGNHVLSDVEISRIFDKTKAAFHNTEKYFRVKNSDALQIENSYEDYKYSSKDLRQFFIRCCTTYFPEFTNERHKLLEHIRNDTHPIQKRKLIELFCEGLSERDDYFKKFTEDIQGLYDFYSLLQEHLTARKYDKYHPTVYYPYPEYDKYLHDNYGDSYIVIHGFDPEYNEFFFRTREDFGEDSEYSMEDMVNIIDQYMKDNFKVSIYEEDETLKNFLKILFSEARTDIKDKYFSNDERYLDELMQRSELKFDLIHNINFKKVYVYTDMSSIKTKNDLVAELKKHEIFESYGISEGFFIETLDKYLEGQRKKHKTRFITANILGDILFYVQNMQH